MKIAHALTKLTLTVAGLLLTATFSTQAAAANIAFGTLGPSASDCTFTCVARLQQDYTAGNFGSNPVNISNVAFYTTGGSGNGVGTFDLYLTTNPNGSSLSGNFNNNVSADRILFASLTKQSFNSGVVNFSGSFNYNPTKGDLIVDILNSNSSAFLFTQQFTATNTVSRVYDFNSKTSGSVDSNYGISTAFTVGNVSSVPEPTSIALLGLGLLGFAASRRKSAK